MPAYIIVESQVTDLEQFKQYQALSPGAITAAGGKFIVRGGPLEVLEGDWKPPRITVVEFPSMTAAKDFYDSALYVAARAKRQGACAFFNMVVVEGL